MKKIYTEEHIQYLKEIANGKTTDIITKLFNNRFRTNKTVSAIQNVMYKNNIKNNVNTRFGGRNGNWKGRKRSKENRENLSNTLKEMKMWHEKEEGSTCGEEREYIKINGQWISRSRYEYEKQYKVKLQEDEVVKFLDGNNKNYSKGNMKAINKKTLGKINLKSNWTKYPAMNMSYILMDQLQEKIKEVQE